MINRQIHRGYIEGYYGRLLSFKDRHQLLDTLHDLSMDSYLYAPKEDVLHRFDWRRLYPEDWCADFAAFCEAARAKQIRILAGIAPGLDFAFDDDKDDTVALRAKAEQLAKAGADGLVLMFDDISADLSVFGRAGISEGQAHARLATWLQEETGCPVFLVPRLYADEVEGDHSAYASDLNQNMAEDIGVFTCGVTIVAEKISLPDKAGILADKLRQPLIIWDNLYCNDYCPRRLFTGEWTGRKEADPILLNGTGMPETDKLLLGLMAGKDRKVLFAKAGVPAAFAHIECCLWHPFFSGQLRAATHPDTQGVLEALEELLWQWKGQLAREWYPYLFGLKGDLLIAGGDMENERIQKTQTNALASLLTRQRSPALTANGKGS